jgi:hypothetical protein
MNRTKGMVMLILGTLCWFGQVSALTVTQTQITPEQLSRCIRTNTCSLPTQILEGTGLRFVVLMDDDIELSFVVETGKKFWIKLYVKDAAEVLYFDEDGDGFFDKVQDTAFGPDGNKLTPVYHDQSSRDYDELQSEYRRFLRSAHERLVPKTSSKNQTKR